MFSVNILIILLSKKCIIFRFDSQVFITIQLYTMCFIYTNHQSLFGILDMLFRSAIMLYLFLRICK